ncbi:MAG: hypothetical protein FJ319_14115 [SAR202 cluster bacterium]|nr:hypothetical protein [SAR202 cluster bacterium]
MRRQRTIYHNDARHYYLYVHDSPIRMEDAWKPVDEVVGTAVDTFSYCVERGDGIFYPSKRGMLWGSDKRPFKSATWWNAYESMKGLIDKGIDPLKLLVGRAHSKKLDFFADLRLASYGGMPNEFKIPEGGKGWGHKEVRDHQMLIVKELVNDYDIDGLELDFPGFFQKLNEYFRPEEVKQNIPVMTEWVRQAVKVARAKKGRPVTVGARIFPSEETNLRYGLDVRTWIKEGLVDFVIPMMFFDLNMDSDMPLEWVVKLAHEHDCAVYGFMMPFVREDDTILDDRMMMRWVYADTKVVRGTMANLWDKGVDGLYTWFWKWPFSEQERSILTELGDRDLVRLQTKRYPLRRKSKLGPGLGYDAPTPVVIPQADKSKKYSIPFYISDDIKGDADHIRNVILKIHISESVTQDRTPIWLNGQSIEHEKCLRGYARLDATRDQLLEFYLEKVRPVKGKNTLEIALESRPPGLIGGVTVEEVEVIVEYGPHPNGLFATVK